jgi:hypothetical protein
MKTNKLKLALILLVCVNLLTSVSVSSQNSEKSSGNIKSIALISTLIGKINQSPTPLISAGPFNKKINSIASLIIKEEEKCIDGYRDAVASSLKKYFNCEILYGSTLTTKSEYQEIIKKYNFPDNLKIDDENFPKILIPNDETNLFAFDNWKAVPYFLRKEKNTKNTTSEICKLLGTDLIAVSYSSMYNQKYGTFGGHAKVYMFTSIFIYNKEGKLVSKAYNASKPVKIVGDDLNEYKTVLGSLPNILDEMMIKASKMK